MSPRAGASLAGADAASIALNQRALLMLGRKMTKRSMTRSDADGDDQEIRARATAMDYTIRSLLA